MPILTSMIAAALLTQPRQIVAARTFSAWLAGIKIATCSFIDRTRQEDVGVREVPDGTPRHWAPLTMMAGMWYRAGRLQCATLPSNYQRSPHLGISG